jgi:hypothetical protein
VLRLVVPIDQRPEQLLTGPAATLVARVRAADPAPPDFDWDQVLPGNPRPWDALPQSEELGPPWSATFVRVWPEAGGGAPFEPILDGQASFTDGKDSTVMVSVSLFDSAESAISRVAMPRRPNARPLTLPARGDQSSGTTETFSTGPTAQTSYVVSIRRGSWMVGVAVGGPSATVPPADFAINLAIRADERLAAALDQS